MRPLFRLLAGLMAALLLAFPALAADRAIIILDASGSMWAQIDGKSRIEIARDSLKQVLAGVPADLELGFMAYGHRSKGDCKDIEMLVPPAPGTADQISAAADALNPKGKTPLTAAVEQAADALKYTEDKATVILITDGIETCDADPCQLATDLEKKGVDFTVNVVGFGLSKSGGAAVKCLADNTGGKYISADDEDGLKDAIQVAVDTSAPSSEEPAPPPSSEEPTPDVNFAPTATLSEDSDPLVDGDGSIAWEFHKVNADGTAGDSVRTEYGNAYTGTIEPGSYVLRAILDNVHVDQPVTIADGQIARPAFDLNAGYLDVRPLIAAGADVDGGSAVEMNFADGGGPATYYGEAKAFVPAGDTKIKVTIGAAVLEQTVSVAAGDRVTRDVVVGAGHVTANAYYTKDMRVEDGGLYIEIVSAKKDIQGNRQSFGGSYGPDRPFDLMPGDYTAVATFDAAKVEQNFTVTAGEAGTVDIVLDAGVLNISAPGASYIEVLAAKKDIQGTRKSFGGTYDVTSNRTLPAGDYHVVVTMSDNSTKEADATVAAGERNEIIVK